MFKDYKKYLETSLKVYLFVLVIIFILKIVGLGDFQLELNNPIILKINEIFQTYKIVDLYYIITLYLYSFFITSIVCVDNSKKMGIYILFMMPVIFFAKYLDGIINNTLIVAGMDILFLFILSFIFNLKFSRMKFKKLIINFIKVILLNTIFQVISMYTRVSSYNTLDYGFIVNFILDFDYILLLIIYHKIYFYKGGVLCYLTEVGSSLQNKISLKKLLQRLQKNLQNSKEEFKNKNKEERLSIVIYTILSLIWNVLSLIIILIMAKLNNAFVECLFILTSFWLSKSSFGKPFHFDSMAICFVVSNLTYYILIRVTTPLGISIIIPILLGVGLSYVTSKFVKKTYKPLYRGMPKDLFEETILQVVDKDSDKYNICYEFYIEKKSDLSLSYKYNYTVSGIRKIKDRINDKIKRL